MQKRNYMEEKEQVYDACLEVLRGRARKEKKDRIQLAEIVELADMDVSIVANAMKWLKRKGIAYTKDGKDGWFIKPIHHQARKRFCWRHGLLMSVEGRGKKRRVFCVICERNPKEEA